MEKKLFRNEYDKVVAGVSSGLANYLQIDITIVRLLFVLSTIFLAGAGLVIYIVMWIIVPVNNDPLVKYSKFNDFYQKSTGSPFNSPGVFTDPLETGNPSKWNTPNVDTDFNQANSAQNINKMKKENDTSRTIAGFVLLVLGIYFFLNQFDLIPYWFNISKIYKLWPLAIIAVGISLIFKNQRKNEWESFVKSNQNSPTKNAEDESAKDEPIVLPQDEKKSD